MIKPIGAEFVSRATKAVIANSSDVVKNHVTESIMAPVDYKKALKSDLLDVKSRINDGISRTMEKDNEKNKDNVSPIIRMANAVRAIFLRKAQG